MKPVQRVADLEKLPINCNKFNKKQINLDNSQRNWQPEKQANIWISDHKPNIETDYFNQPYEYD